MTFKQLDINLSRFSYTVESNGILVTKKRLFSKSEQFIPFENVGSKIRRDRERKLWWLIFSFLFFVLAFAVFIDRMSGGKVGDGAEAIWASIGLILLAIYSFRRKNSVFLVKGSASNSIEFAGTKIYEKRLNLFIKELLGQRDAYLNSKYPPYDGLTTDEHIVCVNAGVPLKDGLFLKKLTKHPLQQLTFKKGDAKTEKPKGICSLTTEKNARKLLKEHQGNFIREGKYIFICGFSAKGYQVGLVATTADPYEIMRYAGTNGANYDVETNDIIAKYKQWDEAFGITPVSIGADFCEAEIINKNIDYKKLAAEVYEFCPDVVEQGAETVERLEHEMKEKARILLWWD
jgi:hypothetical protein